MFDVFEVLSMLYKGFEVLTDLTVFKVVQVLKVLTFLKVLN